MKIKKFFNYFTARSMKGIKTRLWIAILTSVCALLINFFYIKPEYDILPPIVPLSFTMDGEITEWGHRSIISDYAEIRTIFFVIMLLIAWCIAKTKGGTLLRKRLGLLIVDTANLVITTGVNMTLVYIQIANGDGSEKLSEHIEHAVMLIWIAILIVEYWDDRKRITQSTKPVSNIENVSNN